MGIACFTRSVVVLSSVFMAAGLAGCNDQGGGLGTVLGQDHVIGNAIPLPPAKAVDSGNTGTQAPPAGNSTAALGESCSGNPSVTCLSLKYVVYDNDEGTPVISEAQAVANIADINKLWAQCGIAFEIGSFETPDPRQHGLNYNTTTSGELTSIRNAFVDSSSMLLVSTGAWSGSLGAGAANAWAAMPGGAPYGVVLEAPVADYPNLIAHELGHYLNLDHAADSSNVMSAVIYSNSTTFTTAQCNAARSAIQYYWQDMVR